MFDSSTSWTLGVSSDRDRAETQIRNRPFSDGFGRFCFDVYPIQSTT
jgi:hypothetical protein